MDRRKFILQSATLVGGALLDVRAAVAAGSREPGALLRTYAFVDEGEPPLETPVSAGLGGRRFTDLARLPSPETVTPNDRFYIRTRAPLSHARGFPWEIKVQGKVARPFTLSLKEIQARSVPMGETVMECAGNDPGGRFGLVSAARWHGAPLREVLALARRRARPASGADRVLVSGMDDHPPDEFSLPGAGWIFTAGDLDAAFLATRMNGAPLPKDNGGPVRLMVPGWYGCACIKWIREISFLESDAPATTQMLEFASRTHQNGTPRLAGEFRPASMALAALPTRIEKRMVDGSPAWSILGALWGGESVREPMLIQVGDGPWEEVRFTLERKNRYGWSFWSSSWRPKAPGDYLIRLRPKDPSTRSIRLEEGYYARKCRLDAL